MATVPPKSKIIPRNLSFGRGEHNARWWNGGDPIATAFYNALSITFPIGEAMFIDSVRHYRDEVPPALQAEIRDFIKQEVFHSREHLAFNRQIVESGYDVSNIGVKQMPERSPLASLMITMVLEHWTGIFGHAWLKHPEHFAGAPEHIRQLWRWHSLEEVEHKAVAFDTFLHATRDRTPFQRWKMRCDVMFKITYLFIKGRCLDVSELYRQDGIAGWRTTLKTLWFLFGYPGLGRQTLLPYLAFYLPGFHPWKQNDSAILEKVRLEFAKEAPPEG